MATPSTQMAIEFKGKKYSGIYSISGNLMIARIPGIGSKNIDVGVDVQETARALLTEILNEADRSRTLT